jgi:phosphoglycerol transferase MdoB-like AlkP superfamily enzyme
MRSNSIAALRPLLADLLFLLGIIMTLVMTQFCLRWLLLFYNHDLTTTASIRELFNAFIIGSCFDLIVATYISIPLVIAMLLPNGLSPRWLFVIWVTLLGSLVVFLGVLELDFYHEFHARLNSLVFQYMREDASTVISMLWNGFPVIKYTMLWLSMSWLLWLAIQWLNTHTRVEANKRNLLNQYRWRIPLFAALAFATIFAARGTLRTGPPLRWGDAYHSTHLFANHLALNGAYSLFKAWQEDGRHENDSQWLNAMPRTQALQQTQKLLAVPNDKSLSTAESPVLRAYTPGNQKTTPAINNIVVIMMESFSAEYIGALGHDYSITPEFDRLAQRGLLFNHFFSNGTHTHQGMFASIACFPNLPGYEFLMQQPQGAQQLSGLANILSTPGFNNLYLYNGDFSWDNQEGFFRIQGITRFIGRNDYHNPEFIDPTWGVTDQEMFKRAANELNQLGVQKKPFYAILQTLSNHTPFVVPDPLPIKAITDQGNINERLTAMKYSDWALGEFFRQVEQTNWYQHTLFAILGDHGFALPNQVTEIDMLRFHIPLLLIGPGITEAFGATRSVVGTQVDLVPTLVARLGQPFTHACWGRDLLELPEHDPGFGIIKPSGSDKTVALIKGNKILVRPDGGSEKLYDYTLYPHATANLLNTNQSQMKKQLDGFIQTAMQYLLKNQVRK